MKKLIIFISTIFTSSNLHSNIPLIFLGTPYGGWTIPTHILNQHSICYCVGAGEDISFDIELITHVGCLVYSFDPTPRAIKHIEYIFAAHRLNKPAFINNSSESYRLHDIHLNNLKFFPYGIWDKNEVAAFYLPQDPTHVSASIVNLQNTDQTFQASCKTIKTIMTELGHTHLDLLKLDIEGAEYKVITNMLSDNIFPAILCFEFHAIKTYNRNKIIRMLENAGYKVLNIYKKNNYTFIRS